MENKGRTNLRRIIFIFIVILIFFTLINLFFMWKAYNIWPPTNGKWNIKGFDNGDNSRTITLKLDNNDKPHIIYSSLSFEGRILKYTHWKDNSQNTSTIDSSDPGDYIESSMVLDNYDYPHISYHKNGLVYTKFDGSGWENIPLDINGGRLNSISVDSKNNPHIAYQGNRGLYYIWFDGNSWTRSNIDNACDQTSLDLDSDDYPHIVYEYGSDIKYAYWDGDSWNLEKIAYNGKGPSLAIDSHNRPHISYAKELEIFVIRWNGKTWEKERVDSREEGIGHVDGMTSIALDENDNEYLSYICGCNLRFAKKYNGIWIAEVLYQTGGLSPSSIAVDSNGSAHIGNNLDTQVYYIMNVEYDSDGDGVSDSEDFLPSFNNYVFNIGIPVLIIIFLTIVFILITRKKNKENDKNGKDNEDEDSEEKNKSNI